MRGFPVSDSGQPRRWVPWSVAEAAYVEYVALYGRQQSLERIAQRGGFGATELLDLLHLAALRAGAGTVPAQEEP